jgi:membrane-associated HD superfamily phosphohydrolase
MNYVASVADFFKTPKWGLSLLWGAIAGFIPIAGFMLVMGWVITGFWSRREQNFDAFPPFDFSQFDKYLRRGVWPVLMTLLPLVMLIPLFFLLMLFAVAPFAAAANDPPSGVAFAFVMPLVVTTMLLLMCAMNVVVAPLVLRASLMQAFVAALDFRFMKQFFALTWKETLLSTLFVMAVSLLLQLLGLLACCIGAYAVPVITMFATMHLHKQVYALYLARGGEPIPFSPKLLDEPPPLPVA